MISILLWQPQIVNGKCSYSFVVNEIDPESCPCAIDEKSFETNTQQVMNVKDNSPHENPLFSRMQQDDRFATGKRFIEYIYD